MTTDDVEDPFDRAVAREEEARAREERRQAHKRTKPWRDLQSNVEGLVFLVLTFPLHYWWADKWTFWLTIHAVAIVGTLIGSVSAFFDYRASRLARQAEL
jgi:hypothetical protein